MVLIGDEENGTVTLVRHGEHAARRERRAQSALLAFPKLAINGLRRQWWTSDGQVMAR